MNRSQTRNGESWRGGMTRRIRKAVPVTIAAVFAIAMAGCSGDLSRSSSPVALVVTSQQTLTQIDTKPLAPNCDQSAATVNLKAILLSSPNNSNLPNDPRFNTVQLTSYRVSYVRRDGGTLVPAPFTRALSGLLAVGGADNTLSNLVLVEPSALNQAPFAALTTSGGGHDPETGKTTVTMDAILDVFGQTLAGERVSGSTRMTMDFCYSCGGCK